MLRTGRVRSSHWIIGATSMIPTHALACSGPGAMDAILRAERVGWALWGASVVLVGGSLLLPWTRLRGRSRPWALLALVAVHPGWWMSARGGDCGRLLETAALAATALTVLLGLALWFRPRRGEAAEP